MALQRGGKIVVAGSTSTSSIFCCGDLLILRYTNDRRLDPASEIAVESYLAPQPDARSS